MPDETSYNVLTTENGVPVKAWTKGVSLEDQARKQLLNVAQLPFIFKWVAAMPDVHWGIGATVGSVIPTKGAIIPAAVGVDIGCGMMAVQTDLNARDLPDNLKGIRSAIETAVPHGRTNLRGHRALRRLCGSRRMGAGLRALEPAPDDGADRGRGPRFRRGTAVRRRAESHQLPPQLRRARTALRPEHPGHAQGRGARPRRRHANHSRHH